MICLLFVLVVSCHKNSIVPDHLCTKPTIEVTDFRDVKVVLDYCDCFTSMTVEVADVNNEILWEQNTEAPDFSYIDISNNSKKQPIANVTVTVHGCGEPYVTRYEL